MLPCMVLLLYTRRLLFTYCLVWYHEHGVLMAAYKGNSPPGRLSCLNGACIYDRFEYGFYSDMAFIPIWLLIRYGF